MFTPTTTHKITDYHATNHLLIDALRRLKHPVSKYNTNTKNPEQFYKNILTYIRKHQLDTDVVDAFGDIVSGHGVVNTIYTPFNVAITVLTNGDLQPDIQKVSQEQLLDWLIDKATIFSDYARIGEFIMLYPHDWSMLVIQNHMQKIQEVSSQITSLFDTTFTNHNNSLPLKLMDFLINPLATVVTGDIVDDMVQTLIYHCTNHEPVQLRKATLNDVKSIIREYVEAEINRYYI